MMRWVTARKPAGSFGGRNGWRLRRGKTSVTHRPGRAYRRRDEHLLTSAVEQDALAGHGGHAAPDGSDRTGRASEVSRVPPAGLGLSAVPSATRWEQGQLGLIQNHPVLHASVGGQRALCSRSDGWVRAQWLTLEAADAGEADTDRDGEPLSELRGAAEPRVDGLAVLLEPRGIVGRRRIVVQDLGGTGEDDDVIAAVAVEVKGDPRLAPDVSQPPGACLAVDQQGVAAVSEEPDKFGNLAVGDRAHN